MQPRTRGILNIPKFFMVIFFSTTNMTKNEFILSNKETSTYIELNSFQIFFDNRL